MKGYELSNKEFFKELVRYRINNLVGDIGKGDKFIVLALTELAWVLYLAVYKKSKDMNPKIAAWVVLGITNEEVEKVMATIPEAKVVNLELFKKYKEG